jgi:magnesium-transporting ATPase (P-type)
MRMGRPGFPGLMGVFDASGGERIVKVGSPCPCSVRRADYCFGAADGVASGVATRVGNVTKPTIWYWVGSIAAFAVAMDGLWWMMAQISGLHSLPKLERLGAVCAFYAIATVVAFAWSWIVSLVARVRGWTPWNCRMAALLLAIPGVVALATGHPLGSANIFTWMMLISMMLAPKFAFPEKTFDELSRPPSPISLFSK